MCGELLLADRFCCRFWWLSPPRFRAVCSEPARTGHGSGVSRQRDYGQRYCSHALHRHAAMRLAAVFRFHPLL